MGDNGELILPKKKKATGPRIDNKGVVNTPIDFSFQEIKDLSELKGREPNDNAKMRRTLNSSMKRTLGKGLEKKQQKLPVTAIKLSYNQLTSISGLFEALTEILEKPEELTWLDLSYNNLTSIDSVLTKFPKLSMLYLHGNNIRDLKEVKKLSCLTKLKKISLHGNQNVIDKGTRFLKMVKDNIKKTKDETIKVFGKLPLSRIKEQCALLKKFGIYYQPGNKAGSIEKIVQFIFADVTNQVYRPSADSDTTTEDKKITTLEDTKNYRLRVIAALLPLHDLDYIAITPKERLSANRWYGEPTGQKKKVDDDD